MLFQFRGELTLESVSGERRAADAIGLLRVGHHQSCHQNKSLNIKGDALVVLGCHRVWSNVWALEWALCRSPAWSPAGRCVRDRSTAVVKVLLTEQLCP